MATTMIYNCKHDNHKSFTSSFHQQLLSKPSKQGSDNTLIPPTIPCVSLSSPNADDRLYASVSAGHSAVCVSEEIGHCYCGEGHGFKVESMCRHLHKCLSTCPYTPFVLKEQPCVSPRRTLTLLPPYTAE